MKLLYLVLAAASMASACTPRGFRPPPSDEEAMTSKGPGDLDKLIRGKETWEIK